MSVCLCTDRGRLQTVPTLHTSDSSGGWSHPPQTPKPSMTPPPDRAALLLGTHHPEVTMRPGLPSWEVPPLLPRGSALLCVPPLLPRAQPFCVSPACGSSHAVAPPLCQMAGRNVYSMESAWSGHCPLGGPRTIPLTDPGSAAYVSFPARRCPGEARGKDLKVGLDQRAGQLSVRQR